MRPPPPRGFPRRFWTVVFVLAVIFGIVWAIVPGGPPPWSAWLWLIAIGLAIWMRWAEWSRDSYKRRGRGGGY